MEDTLCPGQRVQLLVDYGEYKASAGLFGEVEGSQLPASPYYQIVVRLPDNNRLHLLAERSQLHVL